MKRFLLTILIFFTCIQFVQAQTKVSIDNDSTEVGNNEHVKNAVYLSLGGPSFTVLSLHYERRLNKQLWSRVGFSYAPFLFRGVTVPVGINYLIGKKANFFEFGVGTTFIHAREGLSFSFFDDDSDEDNFLIGLTGTIGYRYQPRQENLFFKITFSPIYIPVNSKVIPFLGVSLGYSF
jgi:hypothetical protein